MRLAQSFLSVSSNFFVIQISSNNPTVDHLREFKCSRILSSVVLLKNGYQFTSFFYIWNIISCRIEKGRTLDSSSQLSFYTAHQQLAYDGRMETSNGNKSLKLCSQSKCFPNSPAKTNSKESLVPLFLNMGCEVSKSFLHFSLVKSLSVRHNNSHISWISSINQRKDLWKINVVSPASISVSDALMPSSESTENITENYNYSASCSNVIYRYAIKLKSLSFWLIVNCKCRP